MSGTFLGIEFSDPTFVPQTSWLGHGPFASWLIRASEPTCVVELGTHHGYSYFSFCQAIAAARMKTKCFAVDTWNGDEHSGFYDQTVFDTVSAENAKYAIFSILVRKNFHEALSEIENGSVDILHVDGRHFYEDVKEDFESWIPKLSTRAIVLFHDTEVREREFGVWRYWAEISETRPSFNFMHQYGLGVLFWGSNIPQGVIPLLSLLAIPEGQQATLDFFAQQGQLLADSLVAKQTALQLHLKTEKKQKKAEKKLKALCRKLETTEQNANNLQGQVRKIETETQRLQKLLQDARKKPVKQLKNKLLFKLLRSLSKENSLLPERMVKRFAISAKKRDPLRQELVSDAVDSIDLTSYDALLHSWALQRAVQSDDIAELKERLTNGPLISIITPVYNPELCNLRDTIDAIIMQSYANWELCIADDNSEQAVRDLLREYADRDSRIKLILRNENGHISRASNTAIEVATGAYIAFLDHDDLLDRDALLLVAQVIQERPDVQIVYTDEDKVREDGSRYDPHFKPEWNRNLLYGINYVSHFCVYGAALVKAVGGLRQGYEGAQDYDLLLRCVEQIKDTQIVHIPKVLYSWRASAGSTAASNTAKPYASEAGRRALSEHLERVHGKDVVALPGPFPFSYRVKWPLNAFPLVSIIIPTRDRLDLLEVAVDSILEKTDYPAFEVLIVDNGSVEAKTHAWFSAVQARDARVRVLRDERPFNYSSLNNAAVEVAKGEMIALVNNDVEVIDADWLREMVSLASRPNVGCVGAKLYFQDGRIQHGGVILGIGGVAGHAHLFYPREHAGYFGRLAICHEVSAVTGACLVVSRALYQAVGGLNEADLKVAFNDVDFCLKIGELGFKNIWTPWAKLYHHESASRGYEDNPEKRARFAMESDYMRRRWGTDEFVDPAYNPNLSLTGEAFSFAEPVWEV
jgi:glycosyltransferase involved in cell wall biosynthesis